MDGEERNRKSLSPDSKKDHTELVTLWVYTVCVRGTVGEKIKLYLYKYERKLYIFKKGEIVNKDG